MAGVEWRELDRLSHVPLYEQLKRTLERAITSGQLRPGDVIPPEKKLCEEFGVSSITVRRALFELVTDGRLIRQVGRGTFVAEASRPLDILLLVVGFEGEQWRRRSKIFGELIGGVGTVLWGSEATFSVQRVSEQALMPHLRHILEERRYDGLIMRLEGDLETESIDLLEHHRLHHIVVKRRSPDRAVNCVVANNWEYGHKAAEHLVDLGHRSIGFVSGWSHVGEIRQRLLGFEHCLNEAGIDPRKDWIGLPATGYAEDGYKAAFGILSSAQPPSALVVASEGTAVGVYAAAHELGISIPRDVAIVGADESGQGETFRPALSSCAVLDHELGEQAADALLRQIASGDLTPRERLVEPTLIPRRSSETGPRR
jgi:DNA-binding LacI/PurR family transcriptional regulator